MTDTPKVVLLILTWNRRDDVVRCLASLSRVTYPNYVPVVIDNASSDGTVAALRAQFPEVMVLENDRNYGYAGGNNVGIRWALQHGADYVLVINNDTEATPGMIDELVRIAESDPRIGVVGCRNVLMEDPRRLWGAYGRITFGPFVVRVAGERAIDGPQWQVVRDVEWLIGNGYLWRRRAIERIGLLDEQLFAYNEDIDWCLRARAAGFRVVYAGTAAILHRGGDGATPSRKRALMWYILGRNGVVLARRYGTLGQLLRFGVLCTAAWLARLGRAGLRRIIARADASRAYWVGEVAAERAFGRGMLDAIRGRPIPFAQLDAHGSELPGASGIGAG